MNKVTDYRDPRGRSLLDRAEQALRQTTALRLEIEAVVEQGAAATVYFQRRNGTRHGPWYVEQKRTLQQQPLAALAAQMHHGPQPGVLVTEYVNPRQAETLRALEQPFIDAAGNAFLQDANFLVYVAGRPKPAGHDPTRAVRAFRPTELKLILRLLCDANALTTPYRVLAERADIALGNVAQTMKVLEAQRYLVRPTRRVRRLINRRKLLDRWVTDYIARLRPGLLLGRYQARQPHWWRDAQLAKGEGQWGGEIAADHWTHYLKPGTATVYVDENPAKLLLKYRLAKDPNGNTELLQRFWPTDLDRHERLVPPIIAYADLLAIGGARNLDAAKELYEAELVAHFTDT